MAEVHCADHENCVSLKEHTEKMREKDSEIAAMRDEARGLALSLAERNRESQNKSFLIIIGILAGAFMTIIGLIAAFITAWVFKGS